MAQLIPLRGLRYSAAAGNLDDLLSPPYDVITESQRQALAERSPYNAVHLELAAGGDERYERVAGLLRSWTEQGILQRDAEPQYYVYEQHFTEGGQQFVRRALICGVEAQPWDEGAVKPHEFTMSGPKADRLRLLEATQTQLSPVFMIARDRAGQLRDFIATTTASREPDVVARIPADEEHRLWAVEAGRMEARHLAPLLSESFYIADGHHRYETAVNYRDLLLSQGELERHHPARFALTAIVAADDAGLVVRPIHRVVPRPAPSGWRGPLNELFEVTDGGYGSPAEVVERVLSQEPRAIVAVGLEPTNSHVLQLKDAAALQRRVPAGRSAAWASILPNVVRYGVLEPLWGIGDAELAAGAVEYSHNPQEVLATLEAHPEGACAFFMNPVGIGEVMALADQGERMPQKSTFFYPKLGTGLVFHPLYP